MDMNRAEIKIFKKSEIKIYLHGGSMVETLRHANIQHQRIKIKFKWYMKVFCIFLLSVV